MKNAVMEMIRLRFMVVFPARARTLMVFLHVLFVLLFKRLCFEQQGRNGREAKKGKLST
jgi:hypothetical protein